MTRIQRCALGAALFSSAVGCNRESLPLAPAAEAPLETASVPKVPKAVTNVPQLAGNPRDWAVQLLRLKQLEGVDGRLIVPAEQWQTGWVDGGVYLQTPQPGTLTRPGADVAFWTVHRAAADDALVEVPSVVGKSLDDAQSELENAGLTVVMVFREPTKDESGAPNSVLDQYPRAPQVFGPKSTVLLHVASASALQ